MENAPGPPAVPAAAGILERRVKSGQCFFESLCLVRDLKLEEGGLLYDVLRAARIIDSWKLYDDAVVARLLHQRLGDAEFVDSVSDDLQGVVDRFALVGDRAFRFVDLESEVHSTLEIEAALQRNASDGVVNKLTVTFDALDDCPGKQRPQRRRDQTENDANTPLQIHAAKSGERFTSRLAFKVTGHIKESQRTSSIALVVR